MRAFIHPPRDRTRTTALTSSHVAATQKKALKIAVKIEVNRDDQRTQNIRKPADSLSYISLRAADTSRITFLRAAAGRLA